MTAKRWVAVVAMVGGASGLSNTALADNAWDCSAVTFQGGAVSDVACAGSFDPPPSDLASLNALFSGDPTYLGFFKDDDSSAGGSTTSVINAWGSGNGQGSITFNVALTDPFVLELKFGQEWSAFRFDTDVAAGTTWTFGLPGDKLTSLGLSHAAIATVPAIPEPSTYALMLAGLAAVGFMAARRRQG